MRIIKKLLIYTTIIGTAMFSILVVFGFIYQKEVVESVKAEINRHLNAEIKVAKIELSFISNFPQASVTLNNVVGFESVNYSNTPDTLFAFEQFSLSFNVIDIFNESYVLQSIEANEGFLNLKISKKGEGNYEIFKSDTTASSSFKLDLELVKLVNCDIAFTDFRTEDRYQLYFPNIIVNGVISDTEIRTSLYGETKVKALVLDGVSYLKDETAKIDVGLAINMETGGFQISRGFLTLREVYDFEVKGNTGGGKFKYTFQSKSIDLSVAETLIPKKHTEFINAYQITGKADVFVEIARNEKSNHPSISGSFKVINGKLKYIETGTDIEVSYAKGTFDLGKLAGPVSTVVDIPEFEIITKEAKASGSFYLKNLRHPLFRIKTKGNADLAELSNMADFGGEFKMEGQANFDIKLKGIIQNLDSITALDVQTFVGFATIQLEESGFSIKDIPEIKEVTASLVVNRNKVELKNFKGNVSGSFTELELEVSNWLNYVLKGTKNLNISGNVSTETFDVNDWVNQNTSVEKEVPNESFSFPKQIAFRGLVSVKTFKSDKVTLTNLTTTVLLEPNQLRLRRTQFNGFEGELRLEYQMDITDRRIWYSGTVLTKNVRVEELLKSFNEFDQTTLTSQNLKGSFSSNIKFKFQSNRAFKVAESTIDIDGDMVLLDGELIEYKLLYDIPKEIESNKIVGLFVNLDQFEKRLHHIKFDTIANHITIKNSLITIPRMEVHSSALNISLQGTHSFTNKIDYYMNFTLRSVLSKKEPITDEYGYLVDDNGSRMLYLHLYTKDGEVQVDMDKFGSKKNNNKAISEELSEAKSILKEELGLFKNDTSVVVTEKEDTFEYEVDLGEFSDSAVTDSTLINDSITNPVDSTIFEKILKKKKKKKKKKENFEEWDFEDDDF